MSRAITPAPTPSQTITVSSTAGFNAGDLVYFNGSTGDYGTPPVSVAGATVSVPAIGPVPLLGGLAGATARDVGIYGGGSGATGFAAILTNGNIVQVYFSANSNYPVFRIVDTADTVIVAETIISTILSNSGTPNIAAAALTGGGFAVAWINTSGGTTSKPCYAVYTNAGAVTTAAAQDTGSTGTTDATYPIRIKAAPGGGFIIAVPSPGASTTSARGYSSTGVAAFGWVTLASAGSGTNIGLAVRNDGSFLLANYVTATSITYAIWSSVGASIIGSTSFTLTNGTAFRATVNAACLSDGTTFVIVYGLGGSGGGDTTAFRFLPTGNVLGTEFYVPAANFYSGGGSYASIQDVTALSSNRFIIGMTGGGGMYPFCYAIFNSSGVCLSGTLGTTSTAAVPINLVQTYNAFTTNHISAIESPTGYITLYYSNIDSAKVYSMMSSTVDNTTGQLINALPTTQLAGNAAATPLAYSPAGSNPLGAAYSVTAGAYNVASTFGAVVKTPEIVYASTVSSISTTTLPDGRVLIAYMDVSNFNVEVAVYSIGGVRTQTLSIAPAGGYGFFSTFSVISISALTSGKFVIAYATSGANYNIKLYSSSFTQIGSTVSIGSAGVSSGYSLAVAGITNDRYVVGYSNSSTGYPSYQVYDNTNNVIVAATTVNTVDYKNVSVAGYSGGGFFITGRIGTGQQYANTYSNVSGNTFAPLGTLQAINGSTSFITNVRPVSNTYNTVSVPFSGGTTAISTLALTGQMVSSGPSFSVNSVTNINGGAIGYTGSGVGVATGQASGVMQLSGYYNSQVALSSTLFQPFVSSAHSQNSMTPSYGNNVGIAYIDVNQKVNYAIVCGTTMPLSMLITSANPSNPVPIYPGATSATPAIQNTVFTGVALQTVPAGGAGLVQVSGTAQLGSTYPSTTTYRAFDHQSQGVPGVKGTITGRAITLQGT